MNEPKNSIKRRAIIASRLARSAFDQSNPERVKARFRAAMNLGLKLDDPLDVGDHARRACPNAPLAVLAATMREWQPEGQPFLSPEQQAQADPEWVFKALSELGVDWTGHGRIGPRGTPRTLMDIAAGSGNWCCARLIARGGASWLKSDETPWDSPIAWLAFTRRDQNAIDQQAWAEACAELNAALASGAANARHWFPVLGTLEISRINAPSTNTFNWTRWFKKASEHGVASWSARLPLLGECRPEAIDTLGLSWVISPSFSLAMARQAFTRPEALAAGLSTPGFKPDPRSLWALGASLTEECENRQRPADQLRASRKIVHTLEALAPWRDILMSANQEPKALQMRAYEIRLTKRRETGISKGWESVLASLVKPTREGEQKAKVPKEVCQAITALTKWLPDQHDETLWAKSCKSFVQTFSRDMVVLSPRSDPYSARERRAKEGLRVLAKAGSAGQSLTCAVLANMALNLGGRLHGDYGWSETMGQGVAAVLEWALDLDLGREPSKQGLWELWGKTCADAARRGWGENKTEMLKWSQICLSRLEAEQLHVASQAALVPKSGNKLRM